MRPPRLLPVTFALLIASAACAAAASSQPDPAKSAPQTVDLAKIPAAPPAPPIYIVKGGLPAASVNFSAYEPRWGAEDLAKGLYHPAPAPLFAIVLEGAMLIKTSNGETRRFRPGDVIRVEDVAPCKGHISVNENDQILRIMVAR